MPTTKKHQKPTHYFKDFYEWPNNWMVIDEDLKAGKNLLTLFEPFIDTLIRKGLSVKIIKNHMANLKMLGEEIIRRLNDGDENNRKLSPKQLLLQYIEDEYGPLIHHWDPNDSTEQSYQKSLDATCRKLYKFVTELF
jgi:Cft2 family RNA processing exonuclease